MLSISEIKNNNAWYNFNKIKCHQRNAIEKKNFTSERMELRVRYKIRWEPTINQNFVALHPAHKKVQPHTHTFYVSYIHIYI